MRFLGMPTHSDPSDGPNSHFPNPNLVQSLKSTGLEGKYLLPAGYRSVIPDPDPTTDKPHQVVLPFIERLRLTASAFCFTGSYLKF